MKIRIAHSPDADDAFMFYPLARDKIKLEGFVFEHILKDIETLNQEAIKGIYEITAISYHAYPFVQNNYNLMTCGSSFGENYGPVLVSTARPSSLEGKTIALPGKLTTASLLFQLYTNQGNLVYLNFDEILPAVKEKEVDAGLIIHEGQLTYAEENLFKLVDLGEWWQEETGLPLPLGGNAVRKDLEENRYRLTKLVKESIQYSLSHEDEALDYALGFGRGLKREKARQFVRMYVNSRTVHLGEDGKKAVNLLLQKGAEKGLIPKFEGIQWIEI